MKKILSAGILLAALVFTGCGLFQKEVSANTKLEGVNLTPRNISPLIRTRATGTETYLTPVNATGNVITVSMMVGDTGGYALFLISPSETGFSDSSITSDSGALSSFNLADPFTVSQPITLGAADEYPADSAAVVSRLEFLFAWIDVDILIDSGPLADPAPRTIRIVYADVDDLGYKRGDLLYKDGGVFKWGNTQTGQLETARPSSPVQITDIAAYSGTTDGMGNQYIPAFVASIPTDKRISLTYNDLVSKAWTFTVVLDMTDGIVIRDDLANIGSGYDLLSAFDILADLSSETNSLGFTAFLKAEGTAM